MWITAFSTTQTKFYSLWFLHSYGSCLFCMVVIDLHPSKSVHMRSQQGRNTSTFVMFHISCLLMLYGPLKWAHIGPINVFITIITFTISIILTFVAISGLGTSMGYLPMKWTTMSLGSDGRVPSVLVLSLWATFLIECLAYNGAQTPNMARITQFRLIAVAFIWMQPSFLTLGLVLPFCIGSL